MLVQGSPSNEAGSKAHYNYCNGLLCVTAAKITITRFTVASFPGSTAQRFLHFGKTRVGSLGSLVRHTTSRT